MSKKIAFGSTHVVIDLPYGNTLKVTHIKDAEILKSKLLQHGLKPTSNTTIFAMKKRKRRNDAFGRTTRVIGIRVPTELYDRVNDLADKNLLSINAWCIKTLTRETKPRGHYKPTG